MGKGLPVRYWWSQQVWGQGHCHSPSSGPSLGERLEKSRSGGNLEEVALRGKVNRTGLPSLQERRMRADVAACQICEDCH